MGLTRDRSFLARTFARGSSKKLTVDAQSSQMQAPSPLQLPDEAVTLTVERMRSPLSRSLSRSLSRMLTSPSHVDLSVLAEDSAVGLDPSSQEAQQAPRPKTPRIRVGTLFRAVASLASPSSRPTKSSRHSSTGDVSGIPSSDMDSLTTGWAVRERSGMLHGAAGLLGAAGVVPAGVAEAIDARPGGVLSLVVANNEGGRPAVINALKELGVPRPTGQKIATALSKALRDGTHLTNAGAMPQSVDEVPLPPGWRARVYLLSDVHVDHKSNLKWLLAATAKLPRAERTVDVLASPHASYHRDLLPTARPADATPSLSRLSNRMAHSIYGIPCGNMPPARRPAAPPFHLPWLPPSPPRG